MICKWYLCTEIPSTVQTVVNRVLLPWFLNRIQEVIPSKEVLSQMEIIYFETLMTLFKLNDFFYKRRLWDRPCY